MKASQMTAYLSQELPMSQATFARLIQHIIESYTLTHASCPFTYDGASSLHFPAENISIIVDPKKARITTKGA